MERNVSYHLNFQIAGLRRRDLFSIKEYHEHFCSETFSVRSRDAKLNIDAFIVLYFRSPQVSILDSPDALEVCHSISIWIFKVTEMRRLV